MAQARIYLETEDNTGYLLPVGAELVSVETLAQKQNRSGFLYTNNDALVLAIRGNGVDGSATPTDANLIGAMTNLLDFANSNKELTSIKLVDHTAVSPLGVALSSAPGSLLKEYKVAYTEVTSPRRPTRWEFLNFRFTDITMPTSFDFEFLIQNVPLDDADRFDMGSLRGLEANITRNITEGVERQEVSFSIRLGLGKSVTSALNLLRSALTGTANFSTNFSGSPAVTTDIEEAKIKTALTGAKVESVQFSYNKFSQLFSVRFVSLKPAGFSSTGGGSSGSLSIVIESTLTIDDGLKVYDRKRKGAKHLFQKIKNSMGEVVLKIDVISLGSNDKGFESRVQRVFSRMKADADWRRFGGVWARRTGTPSVNGDEMGNSRSVTLRYIIGDPEQLEVERGKTSNASRDLSATPVAVIDAMNAAVLEGIFSPGSISEVGRGFNP